MQEIITNASTGEVTVRDLTPEEIAAMQPSIADQRAAMSCTRMQGIIALGETAWAQIETYRTTAPWVHKVIIDDAGDWHRTSQQITFFGYLLGMTDADIDAAFVKAMTITV